MVYPKRSVDVSRDKDDNKFISCAFEAECIFIADLLSLGRAQNVKIVTVDKFLASRPNRDQ